MVWLGKEFSKWEPGRVGDGNWQPFMPYMTDFWKGKHVDSEKYVDFPLSFRVNTIGNFTFKH